MVPTLKVPKNALRENGFINGYIKDEMHDDEYKDCIYLLFKPEEMDKFNEFLANEYERTDDIIEDYDYPNGFIVVVYKLDEAYATDFKLVKEGKYSQTTKGFQELFQKTVEIKTGRTIREEPSLQFRIFNKTEDLLQFWEKEFNVELDRSQELWTGFEEEKEILTEDVLNKMLCTVN